MEGLNKSENGQEKNNKEIVLDYLTKVLKNKELCDFMRKASHSLNLFGKKISDEKQNFLRIVEKDGKLMIMVIEENIPVKDESGNFKKFPDDSRGLPKYIELPNTDLIPEELTGEDFLTKFKDSLSGMQYEEYEDYDKDSNGAGISRKKVEQIMIEIEK